MLRSRKPRRHPVHLLLLLTAAALLAAGCGSEAEPTPGQVPEEPAAPASSGAEATDADLDEAPVLKPDRTYSIDDVVTAGYKKSKTIPTEMLPHATEAWYGFFNQKDVEIWVYPSPDDAIEFGKGPADDATGREWRKGGGEKGAGTKAMFTYGAYVIAGNLVMLCELDVTNCEALVANLE